MRETLISVMTIPLSYVCPGTGVNSFLNIRNWNRKVSPSSIIRMRVLWNRIMTPFGDVVIVDCFIIRINQKPFVILYSIRGLYLSKFSYSSFLSISGPISNPFPADPYISAPGYIVEWLLPFSYSGFPPHNVQDC